MRRIVLSIGLASLMLTQGCQTKTQTGALTGGAFGAAAGAVIDHGGPGGIILGSAIGAIAGGLIGNQLDSEDRKRAEQSSPGINRRIDNDRPLSVSDVLALLEAGVDQDTIIAQLKKTNSSFNLSTQEIIELKNNGAQRELLNYMINQ